MKIGKQVYTRAEVLRRVGNMSQIGGTRHYMLSEGRARGVSAIDIDTGAGLRFTVVPDRNMDISAASYKGTNLVFATPNGEVHPSYYETQGGGWLRTFFGGLLTTCGLTYLGGAGKDGDEDLGAHGRASTTPATRVCDLSRWEGDEYVIEVSGVMEDAVIFGDKMRLTRRCPLAWCTSLTITTVRTSPQASLHVRCTSAGACSLERSEPRGRGLQLRPPVRCWSARGRDMLA